MLITFSEVISLIEPSTPSFLKRSIRPSSSHVWCSTRLYTRSSFLFMSMTSSTVQKKVNFYCTLTTLTSLSRVIPWGCIWKSQPPHRSGSKLHVRSNLLHLSLSKCNFMYFGYFPESKILTNNFIMPSPSPTWPTDHLTYCISVWGGQSFSTNYSLYKLFIVQKHCVKMLLFFYCKRKSTQSMVSLYFFGTLRPFFNWSYCS